MPRKSSGALQRSMSPDLTPIVSYGFSLRKALGYVPLRAGSTNQTLPRACARSAAALSSALEVAGSQLAMLKAVPTWSLGLMVLMALKARPCAMLTTLVARMHSAVFEGAGAGMPHA